MLGLRNRRVIWGSQGDLSGVLIWGLGTERDLSSPIQSCLFLEHSAEIPTGCILLGKGKMLGCLQGPSQGLQQAWV